jgi:hypothetical protein
MNKIFDINDPNIYSEFTEYLSKLNITKKSRYFQASYDNRNCHYIELDEHIIDEIITCFRLCSSKMLIPLVDTYITTISFAIQSFSGFYQICGLNINRMNNILLNYFNKKNLLQKIVPHCNHGCGELSLMQEISNNQEFYSNEMKKKNIITELNDITKNYCNKINNLESKLRKKYDKIKDLENKLRKKYDKIKDLENKNNNLKEEYQMVYKIRNELKSKNDNINETLEEQLSKNKKIEKVNKRLVNLIAIYKYHDFNEVEKYNYIEIKQKNKTLNNEFKRVAKLMKLC